jgi:hypothetical protein
MPRIEVALSVRVAGALAVGGASAAARGSRPMLRDDWGCLVLPGSQVKGRLRHACEGLVRALGGAVCRPPRPDLMCPRAPGIEAPPCVVCSLFGSPGLASPLRWADLACVGDRLGDHGPAAGGRPTLAPSARHASLPLDRRRGTAATEAVQYVETSALLPGGLVFANERAVMGRLDDPRALHLLLAGWRLVSGFGGGESRGLGWSDIAVVARVDGMPLELDASALGEFAGTSGGGG